MTLPIGSALTSPAASPFGAVGSTSSPGASDRVADGGGFSDSLARLINSVDSSSSEANQAVDQMLDGTGDVHDAMIALQRAELTLQLTVQVRNKLVQAYQDIMKMSV